MTAAPARAGALLLVVAFTSGPGTSGLAAIPEPPSVRLAVEPIAQAPERCGPASLRMVFRFYGAGAPAEAAAEGVYSKALRGALLTDLGACARGQGFPARVATLSEDSLHALLARGVPPVLYLRRGLGPLVRGHFAVLVGWDGPRREFLLNDGSASTVAVAGAKLAKTWRASGSQALVVERRGP